jgi:hypothetical protein
MADPIVFGVYPKEPVFTDAFFTTTCDASAAIKHRAAAHFSWIVGQQERKSHGLSLAVPANIRKSRCGGVVGNRITDS